MLYSVPHDHTLAQVTCMERNGLGYLYPSLHAWGIAHGWTCGNLPPEPWERVIYLVRYRGVPSVAGVTVTHHLTKLPWPSHHRTYAVAHGQALPRDGYPQPGGGDRPATAACLALRARKHWCADSISAAGPGESR